MRYRIFIVLTILTAFFLTSCEKDPTDVGSNLLPPDDFINLVTVNSTTDNWLQNSKSFQGDAENLGRSKILLLGNHSGISSSILINTFIVLPDSVFTALQADSIIVQSAWMELQPIYSWGDTSSTLDLSAYRINQYWQHNNFNSDSLNLLSYDNNNIASQVQESDSLIVFNLDKNIVQGWLNARVDTTLPKNYGLLFKSIGNDKIMGFPAANGIEFGALPKLSIQIEKPGEYIDTLSTIVIREDVHVVEGDLATISSDKILLQAGLLGRGYLNIDMSKIPKYSVINKAELSVHYDSLLTEFGTPISDSIEVSLFSDSLNLQIIDSTIAPIFLIRNENYFKGDIRTLLQFIINGNQNYGLRLKLSGEERSVDKLVIDGSTTNIDANKPKLTITYTGIK